MPSPEDRSRCLEMFHRLVGGSGFDGPAAAWLIKHKPLAEGIMMEHFDSFSTAQRKLLYGLLLGMFRESFKRVVDFRVQTERDAECRQVLTLVEEVHRAALQQPYEPLTSAELLAKCEQDLDHKDPLFRCFAAMGAYALTGKPKRVTPVLLAILRNEGGKARQLAVEILGQLRPLDQESVQELRAVANDTGHPARAVAQEALCHQKQLGRWNFWGKLRRRRQKRI